MQIDGWSVSARYRKCGKPGCKACNEGNGHGPYFYGTRLLDGRKVSRYFGRTLPGPQTPHAIQPSTQESIMPQSLTLDDHINTILGAAGKGSVVLFMRVRRDTLGMIPVPEHTKIWLIAKESRGQQTLRAVEKVDYILLGGYAAHT